MELILLITENLSKAARGFLSYFAQLRRVWSSSICNELRKPPVKFCPSVTDLSPFHVNNNNNKMLVGDKIKDLLRSPWGWNVEGINPYYLPLFSCGKKQRWFFLNIVAIKVLLLFLLVPLQLKITPINSWLGFLCSLGIDLKLNLKPLKLWIWILKTLCKIKIFFLHTVLVVVWLSPAFC